MTNQIIDNSSKDDFDRIILWQYDKATALISFIKSFNGIVDDTTKVLWDKYATELNVDNATDYGLAIIGTLIGCMRPSYNDSSISTDLYRRFLKANFKIALSDYSIDNINEYLKTIFNGAVVCRDNFDMTISFDVDKAKLTAEEIYCIEQLPDYTFKYPAAVHQKKTFDQVLFAVVETQPTNPKTVMQNGIPVGCLDDSTFFDDIGESEDKYIPDDERVDE